MTDPTQTGRPSVVAVVLSFDSVDTLPEAMAAVEAQTFPPAKTLVVDNGSRDGSRDFIESLGVDAIFLPENLGVGAGHNRGWEAALADPSVDFIWAVEHDTVAHPTCLERELSTYRAFEERGTSPGAITPRQVLPDELDGSSSWTPAAQAIPCPTPSPTSSPRCI